MDRNQASLVRRLERELSSNGIDLALEEDGQALVISGEVATEADRQAALDIAHDILAGALDIDEDIAVVGTGAARVEVDLMEPLDPAKKPAVHEPPLNHIGLWVDDLPRAVEWLTARGVRFAPGGIRRGAAGHDIAFIHPKGNEAFPIGGEGVLIELVQAPPERIAAASN